MSTDLPDPTSPEFAYLDFIATPTFVLEVGQDDVPRYVAFNACAREKSGKPLSYYLGRPATEVYPKAFGRTAYARHCEVARTGKAMEYELDLPLAFDTHSIRTTLVPYCDPDTGRRLLFGTSQDVSVEKAILERQVNFDTMSKEMEQFVALAAHDLRAPMRNMEALTHLLREDFVDHGDGKVELMDKMAQVAQKSMALITDVLNHAHTVEVEEKRSNFDLRDLCQDIYDVLDPHEEHHFSCTSAQICANRTTMQIALRNIIDNALKFGGKTPLHIDVQVGRGKNGMLDLMVRDDGEGFSKSAITFLNGGAFQTDSGYGMLGVRRMVEARGGQVKAENDNGDRGAVIRFSLPGEWLGQTNGLAGLLNEWSKDACDAPLGLRRRA